MLDGRDQGEGGRVRDDIYSFDRFSLDTADRRLLGDGVAVDLNARYLDALVLLVREEGRLVTKDRFLDEVWHGVPVTDEALTQCVKTLRRALGDDAARPRFIETVPKHGYRFVAPVVRAGSSDAVAPTPETTPLRAALILGAAGTVGAGVAGLIGGLIYGFIGAAQPVGGGPGAASVLIVLLCLTILLAVMGGIGVAFGIAATALAADRRWRIVGGAGGGLIVGAVGKLLGIDAVNLLFGRSPGDITGPMEGLLLGCAVGVGAWLGDRGGRQALRRSVATAAVAGAVAGTAIALVGGRLLAGSLALLAAEFPASRLRLDAIGRLFGEAGLGPAGLVATGALEGALFAGCIVGAMVLAARTPVHGPHPGAGVRTSA